MNKPLRKFLAFSAAAAMLANVPLMGADAKYVAEQVTDKEFDVMIQFPDRNLYIENGDANDFSADQQLISLAEGIDGGVSYASTTMGIYDFIRPLCAEFGFDFYDPSYKLSTDSEVMIISVDDKHVLMSADGKVKSDKYDHISSIGNGFFEVVDESESKKGIIDSSGKFIFPLSSNLGHIRFTADMKSFFVDTDGKDYFTDLTGKRISPEYEELVNIVKTEAFGRNYYYWYGTIQNDYELTPLYRERKGEKYSVVDTTKFEPITEYFDELDFAYTNNPSYVLVGNNKEYDEKGKELPVKKTYIDENGKSYVEEIAINYDKKLYKLKGMLQLDEREGKIDDSNFDDVNVVGVEYLLRIKDDRNNTYDQVLDKDKNVLLEGESITVKDSFGFLVDNGSRTEIYNSKLQKLGECVNFKSFDSKYFAVSEGRCIILNLGFEVIKDDALESAYYVTDKRVKYDPELQKYVTMGYYGQEDGVIYSYDADFDFVDSKEIEEGQNFIINDRGFIFTYDKSLTVTTSGDDFYVLKEGDKKAKVVDRHGELITEVPSDVYPAGNGCFFSEKDGTITFYNEQGERLRKFNASYGSKSISSEWTTNFRFLTTLTDIVIRNKDEETGKTTTYLYDLTTDTIKYSQTGKYDDISAVGYDLIQTVVYPEDYQTPSPSGYIDLWTGNPGFKRGIITMDGVEIVAPLTDYSVNTAKYCYGGCSSPGYRDIAIDVIYNDGTKPGFEGTGFENPKTENPDVDGYIEVNDLFVPIKDFDPEYAAKYGYATAIKTRYGSYVVIKDEKWAIASPDGKLLCDAKYDYIAEFADGIAWTKVYEEHTEVAKDACNYNYKGIYYYADTGEEYTYTIPLYGLITKDGTELVEPYNDETESGMHFNVEHFGNTYYTYRSFGPNEEYDPSKLRYDYGIYKGTEYFNDFTASYGYDTAAQYGDLWIVSKDGLKGVVTSENEVIIPVENTDIMFVPASEEIAMYRLSSNEQEIFADQHYSSPISELSDGSKLVNVKTENGRIKAYQIRDVEETTTTTSATTTSATTSTVTSAVTTIINLSSDTTLTEGPQTTTSSTTEKTETRYAGTWTVSKRVDTDGNEDDGWNVLGDNRTVKIYFELNDDFTGTFGEIDKDGEYRSTDIKWDLNNDSLIITADGTQIRFAADNGTLFYAEGFDDGKEYYFKKEDSPELEFGDPTGDGKIDAKDASLLLVAYSKVSTGGDSGLTDEEKAVSDVNNDGMIDAKDASAILGYYAMVSTTSGDVPTLKEYIAEKAS